MSRIEKILLWALVPLLVVWVVSVVSCNRIMSSTFGDCDSIKAGFEKAWEGTPCVQQETR